jgi:hypothetical protein
MPGSLFLRLPILHPLSLSADRQALERGLRGEVKKTGAFAPVRLRHAGLKYSHENLVCLFAVFNVIHQLFFTAVEK